MGLTGYMMRRKTGNLKTRLGLLGSISQGANLPGSGQAINKGDHMKRVFRDKGPDDKLRKCRWCGGSLEGRMKNCISCSERCTYMHHHYNEHYSEKRCIICGEVIPPTPGAKQKARKKLCSDECAVIHKKRWSCDYITEKVSSLTDGYIANLMRMRLEDVPTELIEAKRSLMKLKRKVAEYEND